VKNEFPESLANIVSSQWLRSDSRCTIEFFRSLSGLISPMMHEVMCSYWWYCAQGIEMIPFWKCNLVLILGIGVTVITVVLHLPIRKRSLAKKSVQLFHITLTLWESVYFSATLAFSVRTFPMAINICSLDANVQLSKDRILARIRNKKTFWWILGIFSILRPL